MSDRIETRLYVTEPLAAGTVVGLDHGPAHYLRSVLRLEQGARVALFNGRDGAWAARIEGLGKGWASLTVEALLQGQRAEPDLWLCFAPIKRARLDFLVEKAAELGVSRLQPVITQHTVVTRVNLERLKANVREAAEQCERLTLPEVAEPLDLPALLASWPVGRRLFLCAEAGPALPLAEAVQAAPPGPAAFMTGPEGGFSPGELDDLAKRAFVSPVGLGPRILRADTAAIAALAAWQALAGDGKERPPPDRATPGRAAFAALGEDPEA